MSSLVPSHFHVSAQPASLRTPWEIGQSLMLFSCSVVSDSLRPHGLQHAKPPCPSQIPGAGSNSCPLSRRCHPTILFPVVHLLPSIFPSIGVFSNESVLCNGWPKYWRFSFIIIHLCNEYSGLIFFRSDCFHLPVVQGTLKSLLQHHSSKASIIGCSAFFTVDRKSVV